MRTNYLFVLSIVVLTIGCIKMGRVEPPYPKDVPGWKVTTEKGVKSIGSFVLKKGEATDNKKIEIKVLEFYKPDFLAGTGSFQGLVRVKLQFTRLVDGKVLCEGIFGETQSGMFSQHCSENLLEFGIHAIDIRAINLKEGWVYFDLNG